MENKEISFGRFRLDLGRRELLRDGEPVRLHRRALDILSALAAARGEVLSKDALMARLWPGRVVEEGNLHVHVSALRKAMGEHGEGHSYIVTVPGRGYRFTGPVVAIEDALPAAPPRDEAECRQITVLSCELIGAGLGTGGVDLEDLKLAVRTFRRCVADTAKRHGGFIYRQLGNNALALFGYPAAHEHDAEQAVRTGLELCAAVRALTPIGEAPMRCRVGVATGLVIISDLTESAAFGADGIIGDVPDAAARLLAAALPDTVAVGPATRRLVGDLFECREFASGETGGYQVLGEGPAASRFEALHGAMLTPLVGREEELGLLTRCWARAGEGEGQVVFVSGEAGIGKSRLCQALAEQLAADPYEAVHWQCSPHHRDSALYPIASQIGRAAGFAPGDGARQRAAKAEHLFVAAALGADQTALLTDLLGLSPGLPPPLASFAPQRRRLLAFEALISVIATISARQRMLLVFEDAHWIDPSSLEFLAFALDRIRRLRVLMMITARPEFALPGPDDAHIRRIVLGRMSRRESALLALRIAGKGLPSVVVDQIVNNADGVPLFIEELTKMMVERDRSGAAGEQREVGTFPGLSIPSSLRASLVARLDRLGAAKEAAQIAAVIGRDFSYRLLAAVSKLPEPELHAALARLTGAELIFQRGIPPDATYVFKHALVRDATYSTLLRSRRRQLHARVAEALEEYLPETATSQPALLAQHCTEAGLTQKAVGYRLLAGQQAWAQTAATEAVAQLQKGLAMLRALPDDRIRLQLELDLQIALRPALAAMKGSATAEVGETIAHARSLAEQVDRSDCLVPLMLGQWAFHLVRSEHRPALSIAEQIEQTGAARNDVAAILQGRRAIGWVRCYLGHFVAAREALERSRGLGDPVHRIFTAGLAEAPYPAMLGYLAVTSAHLGYIDQARSQLTEALAESRRLRHAYTQALVLLCANWTATIAGFAERKQYAEELQAVSEADLPTFLGYGTAFLGLSLATMGKAEEGVALLTHGLAKVRGTGTVLNVPRLLMGLAETHALLGRSAEGIECLGEAQQIIEITEERANEAELYRLQGDLIGDPTRAEPMYHRALAVARRQSAKLFELRAATCLAKLWRQQGKMSAARELLKPAYSWFTEGLDTPILENARTLLGQLEEPA